MNCKKCGSLMESGDVLCKKCGAPIDVATQFMSNGNPTSQPIVNVASQKQKKQSTSTAIMIALIVIIAIGIISLLIWQLVFGGTKGKFSNENNNNNNNSEVRKIINQKESIYSLTGTWEGFMLDTVLEITIDDSKQCTINAFDDFWDYDINTYEAEIVDNNVLKMYSQTVQGPYTELRTNKFSEPAEWYIVAVSKDQTVMIPKDVPENSFPQQKMQYKRTSNDKGILGTWEAYEKGDNDSPIMIFTNEEKCDFDSSGKCYKIIRNTKSAGEMLYYDDNFIYVYMPGEYERSSGSPASVERWFNKLFGIMRYDLDGNELTLSYAMVLNKIKN